MRSLNQLVAIALLVGTALLCIGAVMHPVLVGDAATKLRIMANASTWRATHLIMLTGSALVTIGIWVRLLTDRSGSSDITRALIASLAVIAIGEAINALDMAYMASPGWYMSNRFAAGDSTVVPIFAATHGIGRMFARFGNCLIAFGAFVLGYAEWEDATQPRWIAALAWLAAIGGCIGILFDEASMLILGAVSLLCGWQFAVAIRALMQRDAGTSRPERTAVR